MERASTAAAHTPSEAVLNQIGAAVAESNFQRAFELADAEIARGAIHPNLFGARAMWFEQQQRFGEALDEFQRARALSPRNVALLNAIGLCLTRLYRLYEAIEVFDEAIRIDPTYMPTYHRKGIALGLTGDLDAAQRTHERALQLDPQNVDALAGLASTFARKAVPAKARQYAERALKLDPSKTTAVAALAMADNSEGAFESAEARIRPLLDDPKVSGRSRASALGILGDALDGQERTAEAFAAYSEENSELLRYHAPRFAGRKRIATFATELADHFKSVPGGAWQAASATKHSEHAPAEHIFLLGFFRSGTTLLEQILESHPGIVTLEERDLLARPAERFLTSSDGLGMLAELSDAVLSAMRADYWDLARNFGLRLTGNVMVDKNPLNTLKLPLIAKLFPDAKILFALRDPRDVVLSCFRRHFEVNAAMYELLTLEGAVQTYDAVMDLAEVTRAKLALPFHDHRYEDLIADFEGRMRAVCEFVGVPYTDEMANFSVTARGQDIRSPSGPQVRRGIYRDGLAQWRRYGAQLEPVRPILNRWIERFGYPPE